MSGLESADAFEASRLARNREEVEGLIEAARIGAGRHQARSEERLDLRSEQQPVAAVVSLFGPEQWADAEAIAAQHEAALLVIENGQSELAMKMLEEPFAEVFPEMRH